jgi:hypothetical protein
VVRQDLVDEEQPVAPPGHRLAHQPLGLAVGVHLGGVDERQPQVDPEP